ncbi:MAG: alpha/beta hydrolase [Flaviaesturariibacter sp.]|nr:alpha/beta hydrolase [Flaviaesturariibacter sp.]
MKALLLLHGALGSARQLAPLATALSHRFDVHTPQLPGHGGDPLDEFSIPAFASFIAGYIHNKGLEGSPVFGYSMGGYIALHMARQEPSLFSRVATLGTKLDWTEDGAANEASLLDPASLEEKLPAFAETLRERHAPADWKEVTRNTAALMLDLGRRPLVTNADLATLPIPVMLMLGDRDRMVSLDETLAARKALRAGSLAVLPGTPHPLEAVDPGLVSEILIRFFEPC